MRPVGFDREVVRKKRVGAIGDGQRFREFSCKQGVPCHIVERLRRLLAGLALAFRLLCLHFRRQRLLQLQRFSIASGRGCLADRQFL